MSRCLLVALLALGLAGALEAGPELGVQGRLTDASTGAPLSGDRDLSVRLYDAASGGTELSSDTVTATLDEDGRFAIEADAMAGLTTELDQPVFVEVEEVGGSVLTPRFPLVPAARALFAESAEALAPRVVLVPRALTPNQSALDLLSLVASITDATTATPYALVLAPGEYDFDFDNLILPDHVSLFGWGPNATTVHTDNTGAVVTSGEGATLQGFRAEGLNTGLTVGGSGSAVVRDVTIDLQMNLTGSTVGIACDPAEVLLEDVDLAITHTGGDFQNTGIRFDQVDDETQLRKLRRVRVTIQADGATAESWGLRVNGDLTDGDELVILEDSYLSVTNAGAGPVSGVLASTYAQVRVFGSRILTAGTGDRYALEAAASPQGHISASGSQLGGGFTGDVCGSRNIDEAWASLAEVPCTP